MSHNTPKHAVTIAILFASGLTAVHAAPGTDQNIPQGTVQRQSAQVAELTPRGTAPRTPMHSTATVSSKTLADMNRRLNAMQQQINRLQAQVNQLSHTRRAPAGGGSSSTTAAEAKTMAAEAKTMAAEARDIAQRAEQKADQALSAAQSH